MAKSRKLVPGVLALVVGAAIVGCNDSNDRNAGDEQTTETRSGALTTTLFEPYVTYPTGSWPEAVAIGDLDGDGRNDVALLTSYYFDAANDYMVHVFLQNTDGSLKPRVKYPVGGASSSIDIGDVNGDGRADVVVGHDVANSVGVLLQNATGTLDAVVSYPTVNAYQVKIADLNNDGRMDVAALTWGSNGSGVAVLLQTEAGTLAAPVTYAVPHGGYDELDAGDVDGDGRTDLVVMSGQSYSVPNVNVLLQTPDGTFGAPASYSIGSNILTHGVAVGDTNGDGRDDIVVTYAESFIARFLQNSGGTMDPAVSYRSYAIPSAIVLADVDDDGRKDALVIHSGFNRIGVYRQFPGGDFLTEELYATPGATHHQPQGLAVGDISGDGRPDAVIADSTSGLVVLRHVQDTSLALAVTAPTPTGGPYYVGAPLTIRWTAGDTVPLAGFDVAFSGGGVIYTPIAGCTGLPATATECSWTPLQAGINHRIRVTARDTAGNTASSETTFSPVVASITVTAPNINQFVGVGTTTTIGWTHNLPTTTSVRIELSRDGGGTFETLADAAPIGSATSGSFAWNVTGPTTSTARVRVTANGSLPATGTANFAITTAPTLTLVSPVAGATVYTTSFGAAWTSNAGNTGTVRIELSRDGGSTFETIADAITNQGSFMGAIPGPGAADARVRVTLTVSGAESTTATSASFTLIHPTVTVTSPVAGATAFTGTPLAITWSTNMPAAGWSARVELSRNGGSTYEILAWSVPNSGSLTWNVAGPATSAAQIRVTITGQGSTAATSGAFAIAVPSLTVTSPAAGGAFYAGMPVAITWATNLPAAAPVTVALSRDGGSTYEVLASSAPNTGSFTWVATGPTTGAARARVTVGGTPSLSATSGTFAITVPALNVTSPAVGAALYAGAPLAITWSSNLPGSSPVVIELSRDGGGTYETLAPAAPNTGRFDWVVTGPDSAAVVARVSVTDPVAVSGTSGPFSITTAGLIVTGPAAGTVAYAGTPVTISWTDNVPAGDAVSIELSRDGGATFEVVNAAAANTGSFNWIASGPDTAAARVRVTWSNGAVSVSDIGPTFQIVTPSLAVTSPAAGASWAIGTSRSIAWSSNLPAGTTALVELSRDGGSTWTTLSSAASGGSLAWTATGPATGAAVVRVTANGGVPAVGTSGVFTIGNPAVTVTSPAAGAKWTIGIGQTITWTSNLLPTSTVKIQLSRDGGSTYTTLASSAPNTGSFAWTATGPATTNAVVRVAANGFTASSVSGKFALVAGSITVTSPNTAVTWTVGTVHAVTWTHNLGASAQFKIEVSRAGVWSTIAPAVPGGGATSGTYDWTVTGPTTTNAKIRVTWTGGTTKDTSDVSFRIN